MIKNEKGLTLVEVLAGIVLLSIITTLTTIIIVQIFKSDEAATNEITLKQDTNLMMSSLRKEFHDTSNKEICLDTQGGRLAIDEDNSFVNYNAFNESNKANDVILENGCIKNINRNYPLKVQLSVKNSDNEEMEIETTLVKGGRMATSADGVDDPCYIDPNIEWTVTDKLPCTSDKNIWWTGKDEKDAETSCKSGTREISGYFKAGVKPEKNKGKDKKVDVKLKNLKLDVGKSAFFHNKLDLDGNNSIALNGNACFLGEFDLDEFDVFTIKENAHFKKKFESEGENEKKSVIATMSIGKNARFDEKFEFDEGIFKVGGNATFLKKSEFEDASIDITGRLFAKGEFKYDGDEDKNEKKILHAGSILFNSKAEIKEADLKVDGLLEAKKKFKFDGDVDKNQDKRSFTARSIMFGNEAEIEEANVTISEDAIFGKSGQTKFKKSSVQILGNLEVGNNFEFDGDSNNIYLLFDVKKNATFNNNFKFEDGNYNVHLNSTFNGETEFKDSIATIQVNGYFNSQTKLDKTNMVITNDLFSKKALKLDNNAKLEVKGNPHYGN